VCEHVAVGMADGAFVERKGNATNDERAAFGEAVEIVADAAADATVGAHA